MTTNSGRLDVLAMPIRAKVALNARGIETIDQLVELTHAELLQVPNLGRKTAARVIDVLSEIGYRLRNSSLGAKDQIPPSSSSRGDQSSPSACVKDSSPSSERTYVFQVDTQTDEHQMSRNALRIQAESINEFVAQVYTQPERLSDLLARTLLTDSQVNVLRQKHLPILFREISKIWMAYIHEELPPNNAEVLRRRFFLIGQGPDTLAEIGTSMNLSRERIRQLQQKAIGRLRYVKRRQELINRALYVSVVLLSTPAQLKDG